jgi:hypothetical protein
LVMSCSNYDEKRYSQNAPSLPGLIRFANVMDMNIAEGKYAKRPCQQS